MPIKTVGNQRFVDFASYDYERFPVDLVRHIEPSEMQLYMYLWSMRCRNIEHLVLFSSHVTSDTGLSYKTYNKAFHNLIRDGFLILDSRKPNTYTFCPNKYTVSDEELMQIILDYICTTYSRCNYILHIYKEYKRCEDELDIFPEYDKVDVDYMKEFESGCDVPF